MFFNHFYSTPRIDLLLGKEVLNAPLISSVQLKPLISNACYKRICDVRIMSKKVGLGLIEVSGRFRPRIMVSTGMWIRDYLLGTVEDYPYHMWKVFKQTKRRPGSYQNFRNYIYWLLKLNLIKFVREEPSRTPHFEPRRYYTYVPANVEKVELWRNPIRALYPKSWEKHHS